MHHRAIPGDLARATGAPARVASAAWWRMGRFDNAAREICRLFWHLNPAWRIDVWISTCGTH